jgi:cell shape-determining protein MreD
LWVGKTLGLTSIALAVIGVISGLMDKTFSKDSRMIILLMGGLCTVIYEVLLYFMQYVVFAINVQIIEFIQILLIEITYNVIIIIILYPLMKITGYEIENEVKGDKILTRYF